jgi:nucleoside-diphosphate-sugar epimerase
VARVLVTGATGFLGQHLVRDLLAGGDEVHLIQRASSSSSELAQQHVSGGATLHAFDAVTEVEGIVREVAPSLVFHLATHFLKGHTAADIAPLIEANVVLGTQVFEGLVGSGAKVVSAMSFFQFREGAPMPVSLYSATKQAFLDVSDFYRVRLGLDITQVVLYDTFGPGDTRDKLVPHIVAAASSASALSLGPAAQPINLLYVDDVIAGLRAAAHSAEAMLTVRAPQATTVGDVVSAVERASGVALDATFNNAAQPNDIALHAGEWPTPADWQPRFTLDEGVARMWQVRVG